MKHFRKRILALFTALSLLLASCGPKLAATTMHLMRSEGTVGVFDEEGDTVTIRENLGLYSGYQVGTWAESFAWVDLDEVKLTKLDENSQIEIQKEDRHLEIAVKSGSLFFNVTEPLEEDEILNIRTSSMLVGIRGTCGWVEALDSSHMNVYILEGTVECTVTDPQGRITTAAVSAGEAAYMSISEEGEGSIVLDSFNEYAVPAFVLDELREDEVLAGQIDEASGLELQNWDDSAAFAAALESINYYGDPAACTMTPEQRAAYAQILREEIDKTNVSVSSSQFGYEIVVGPQCLAGLVDLGNGVPALMYGSGAEIYSEYGNYLMWPGSDACTVWGIWQFVDGEPVKLDNLDRTSVYTDHLFVGGHYVADPGMSASVYPFENGRIASTPSTTAQEDWYWDASGEHATRVIDGQPAAEEQLLTWTTQWAPIETLAGFSHGSDVAIQFWGLAPAEDVLSVLEGGGTVSGENNALPAVNRTVSTYDPNTLIRRTTVAPAGAPLEMYYEIPVFPDEGEGYQAINAFFQALEDEFLSDENVNDMRTMSVDGNPHGDTYSNAWSASVTERNERYVSVTLSYFWYMGGVVDYGLDGYVFDPETGHQLTLTGLTGAAEGELKELIVQALEQEYPEIMSFDETVANTVRAYDADAFDFYVENGQVHVCFDKYEISYGAAGAFDVVLPLQLN